MKKGAEISLITATMVAVFSGMGGVASAAGDEGILRYVNPFIGTADHGHTFPGAVVPEGLVQLSPDTQLLGWDSSSGYAYESTTVYGFSHTHFSGTGIGGLGDILFMPYSQPGQQASSSFQKDKEFARPGFYEVTLDNSGVRVELTASPRVGFHRYHYPVGQPQRLRIDLGHVLNKDWGSKSLENEIRFLDEKTIAGSRVSRSFGGWARDMRVHFVATFSQPIKGYAITDRGESRSGREVKGTGIEALLEFEPSEQPLEIKVALSPVDVEGAHRNLEAEGGALNFDQARSQAARKWAEALQGFEVTGGSEEEKTVFYTALYHTKMAPVIFQDIDGRYLGMDRKPHVSSPHVPNYSVYSLWDTFRALHPLKTITEPDRAVAYALDLVKKQKEGGILPKWELHGNYTGVMVGYPAVSVIADAMVKYPDAFSPEQRKDALKAAIASSTWHPEDFKSWDQDLLAKVMTPHIKWNEELGYVPADETSESVSYGLENAYYDWAIAQIARLAGSEADYQRYLNRSQRYNRYFDFDPRTYAPYGVTGFMRPVLKDGSWRAPYDPYNAVHETGDYTEGNGWQWTWFVPHDIEGLKKVMGGNGQTDGDQAFLQNLNALFAAEAREGTADMTGMIGQYVHGNEPDQHVPYLYNDTAEPWKTQEYVDLVFRKFYDSTPSGLDGNEDVGAMSAWYVMSAMGFYQVTPGTTTYTIGRPLFDKMVFPVKGGSFTVTAENNGPKNMYVKSVMVNGKPLEKGRFFDHSEFKPGGTLHFVMSDKR